MRLVIHIRAIDDRTLVDVNDVDGLEVGDVIVRILGIEPVAEGLVAVLDKLFFRGFHGDGVGLVEDGGSGVLQFGEREAVDAVVAHGFYNQAWQSAELPRPSRRGDVLCIAHRPLPSVQLTYGRLAQVASNRQRAIIERPLDGLPLLLRLIDAGRNGVAHRHLALGVVRPHLGHEAERLCPQQWQFIYEVVALHVLPLVHLQEIGGRLFFAFSPFPFLAELTVGEAARAVPPHQQAQLHAVGHSLAIGILRPAFVVVGHHEVSRVDTLLMNLGRHHLRHNVVQTVVLRLHLRRQRQREGHHCHYHLLHNCNCFMELIRCKGRGKGR